jgi:dienelactone hydrolase
MKLKIISLVILSAAFFTVVAQQTEKVTPSLIGYLEYLPQGYHSNSEEYPVVISLHGIKEKGSASKNVDEIKESLDKVAHIGLPRYVASGQQYSFILISPQLKSNMHTWTGNYLMEVINHVKTYLRIDSRRIYLTGLSLGGGGLWEIASEYPDLFAAILPICSGYNDIRGAEAIAAANIPTWGFHGDADRVVGEYVTVNMINEINKNRPSPLAKLTILPGVGHAAWDKVYKETSALDWLLSFRKGSVQQPTNASPVANGGSDQTITLPSDRVTLKGQATDSDGTIDSYSWVKKSGGTVTLSEPNSTTTVVSDLSAGTYVFTFTARDNKGAFDSDDVTVVVKAANEEPVDNATPIAYSGKNRSIDLPTNSITIYGTGEDSDGSIVSYQWTKVRGGSVNMSGTGGAALSLSGLTEGIYVFKLTVTDDKGAVDTDAMLLAVRDKTISSK